MDLLVLSKTLGDVLKNKSAMLATAESCTGGGVAQVITEVPGSSAWFERGFITYSNFSKQEMLGVEQALLEKYGAVSEQCACAMAEGALHQSKAQYALAVTGIAGPNGGSAEKPVGTVCFAWAARNQPTQSLLKKFDGTRKEVRAQAVVTVLVGLIDYIKAA